MDRAEERLEPGHRLDRYELLCPIAQGGMAAVWLARQHGKHGFEKLVAVKTILALYANDHRFQKMFLDEARIASAIEHQNVAQILDLGEENDVLYIAMEWVDGDSLSKLFRAAEKARQQLPVGIVCRVLSDTCAGLHAAHELRDKSGDLLNVVHRDVSPQNILVSTKGQAKLIDFGIAKARDRVAGDTNTGFLKGKILYMAPEQALGKAVDRRADVWAIGAVMYHLFAGVPPFEGANQLATLHLLTRDEPPPPLPPHVPKEVADVLMRALARDPEERIATAEDLQRQIETAMVASGHTAIHADVAAFVNLQLVDRVVARRKAMDLALDAAKHRQKLNQMLKPADSDSGSGIGKMLRTRTSQTPSDASIQALSASELVSDVPSSATLGSAAVVSPRPSTPHGRQLAVGVVMLVCALVAAVAVGISIARHRDGTVATSAPQVATPRAVETTAEPKPATTAMPPATSEQQPAPTVSVIATASVAPPRATTTTTVKPRTQGTSKPAPSATVKNVDDGF